MGIQYAIVPMEDKLMKQWSRFDLYLDLSLYS